MLSFQMDIGCFKWEVKYKYCDKEETIYVWADNQEDAKEEAVKELIKMNKATNCTILWAHKINFPEDI